MRDILLFISIYLFLGLGSLEAQVSKYTDLNAVSEAVANKTSSIQNSQKDIRKEIRKLSKKYDSARFSSLIKNLINLNAEAPLNTVASPSELFKLKKRYELTRSEIIQLERLEYQLAAAKDEWHHYAQNGEELKPYLDKVKSDTILQQQLDQKIEELARKHLLEGELPELANTNSLKSQYFRNIDQFSTIGGFEMGPKPDVFNYSKEDFKRLASGNLVKPFQGKEHLLSQGHKKMNKLKEKFSSFGEAEEDHLSKNSLQKFSFKQRLQLGGTFQMKPIDKGLKIDLNPTLSYSMNRQWVFGVGGNYRLNFGSERSSIDEPNQVNGLRTFINRSLLESTFFHLELEYLSIQNQTNEEANSDKHNSTGLLIGFGRTFTLSKKLSLTAHTLYHLNHAQSAVYSSPWVFRIGFRTNRRID